MLKVELHSHTSDDPFDRIPYTTGELIDRAVVLGYHALAVTLHDRQLDSGYWRDYAAERGLVLIPGIERTIHGRHVLLLSFSRAAEEIHSFDDLIRLKRREPGLVIAPHPFFPTATCLREVMDRHVDVFDAVEWNAMFTPSVNFNQAARSWARRHGKPLVGNGDVHRLRQLGSTYSLVDAEPDAEAICAAIRAGAVRVESTPLDWASAAATMTEMLAGDIVRLFKGPPGARLGSDPGLLAT